MGVLLTKYLKAAISYQGIHRIESYPVPEAALRETILNAVIHRDYAQGTAKGTKKGKAKESIIEGLEQQIKAHEKIARDALAKAKATDAAVFDLKAVNPNAVAKMDARTPAQIIQSIEEQGKIVSAALSKLKTLLSEAA